MTQSPIGRTSRSDMAALRASAREDFAAILANLDGTLKTAPKLFPNGIELLKLTVKAGTNIEFSVVIAGKDASKLDQLASISE